MESVRDLVLRLALELKRSTENNSGEEGAGTPAHGDPRREVASHGERGDFGGVGGGEGLEDTPWETTDEVTGEQHLDVLSEEQDED